MNIQTSFQNLPHHKKYLKIVKLIEQFLEKQGFQKIIVPLLSPALIPEDYLEVFETTYTYLDTSTQLYLTPSPELFLKRLIAQGMGNCYFLGPSFRNSEPHSPKHTPQFTMLEMYAIKQDYMYMANVVLKMFQYIAKSLSNKLSITYNETTVDFSKWEKITVAEAFARYSHISDEVLFNQKKFIHEAQKKGYIVDRFSFEDIWSQMYAHEIEPHLGTNGHPTLIYDYPIEFASLAKPNQDGKTAQRFECYIAGVEIGNCYSELTDWKLQQSRFNISQENRVASGKIAHPIDMGFIDTLKKGMPECVGIAIGVERLAMTLLKLESIEELQLISIA